jgi:hypothetical protein
VRTGGHAETRSVSFSDSLGTNPNSFVEELLAGSEMYSAWQIVSLIDRPSHGGLAIEDGRLPARERGRIGLEPKRANACHREMTHQLETFGVGHAQRARIAGPLRRAGFRG